MTAKPTDLLPRLSELPGWSNLPSADQKALQKLVIQSDTDIVNGMTPAELQTATNSGSVALSETAKNFLTNAMAGKTGMLPALKVPSGQSGTATATALKPAPGSRLTFAFDGSYSLKMWGATMDFAKEVKEKHGKPLPLTYFINTCYFDPNVKGSVVGKADSPEDARLRWAMVQTAINEGHEIGNHTVRHHNGRNRSEEQWQKEMTEFHQLVQKNLFEPIHDGQGKPVFPVWKKVEVAEGEDKPANAVQRQDGWYAPSYPITYKGQVLFDQNGKPNLKHPDLIPYRPVGFRAPELGHNAAMYKVLERMGYVYDTSKIVKWRNQDPQGYGLVRHADKPAEPEVPQRPAEEYALYLFPLVPHKDSATIPMDWNYDAQAKEGGERMEQDYKRSILAAAREGRPWNLGHHFSLPRNGAYWTAMKNAIVWAAKGCPDEQGRPQIPKGIDFLSFKQVAEQMGDPRKAAEQKPEPEGEEPNT